MITRRKIIVYTDGSAVANPKSSNCGLGGFGIYIRIEQSEVVVKELFFSEGWSHTKTGRMEVKAIITAFQKIEDKLSHVFLYSDSEYALKCVTDRRLWIWEKRDWKGIANPDLMKVYLEEYRKFRYHPIMQHVRGHQDSDEENVIGNCIADRLADYKVQKSYRRDLKEEMI